MSQADPELQALSQMMMEIESRLEVLHGELQNLQMIKEDVEMAIVSMESISTESTNFINNYFGMNQPTVLWSSTRYCLATN